MKISVIIATYNRCEDLKIFLESLWAQEIPQDLSFEILIADNNSKDATKAAIEAYAAKFTAGTMHYIFEQRQGKCFALNTAILRSKGDILIFTDDDVILPTNWFKQIDHFINRFDFDAACGRVLPRYQENIPKWIKDNNDLLSGPIVTYDYGTDIKPYDQKEMHPLIGANLIVKRRLFDEVGLFNTDLGPGRGTFGDDTEMCLRWEKKNKKLYYAGTISVWHPVIKERTTWGYIARWNMASGKYELTMNKGRSNENVIAYFGVPRYLIRRIIVETSMLLLNILNKRGFLSHWVTLFRVIGTAQAYRQYSLSAIKRS